MTHEPIHTVHLTPHITWQGTQAELEAMLAEGWPMGSASEIIAACKRDAVEAEAYAEELEAKLAKAVEALYFYADGEWPQDYPGGVLYASDDDTPEFKTHLDYGDKALATLAELKGETDE